MSTPEENERFNTALERISELQAELSDLQSRFVELTEEYRVQADVLKNYAIENNEMNRRWEEGVEVDVTFVDTYASGMLMSCPRTFLSQYIDGNPFNLKPGQKVRARIIVEGE